MAELDWKAPTSRDFPQEWHEENGSYLNKCSDCGENFIGRKRRVVCRDCREKNQDQQINNLKAQVAELRQDDHPWNTVSVIESLIKATEHLLNDHSCDQHGYEGWEISVKRGKEILKQYSEAKAKEGV